jgi:chemotaxis signal transduction protein
VAADLDDLAPPPANVSSTQQKFYRGVCQAGTRMATVLDLEMVLSMEEYEITNPGGG